MRPGDRAARRPAGPHRARSRSISRLELVVADARPGDRRGRAGRTPASTSARPTPSAEPVLEATDLTRRHVLDHVSRRRPARARSSAWRVCSGRAGARPPRRSTARSRSTRARSRSAGEPVRRGSPRAAIAAGHRPRSPRTARPRASSRRCRSATTSCWPPCRRCRAPGSSRERRQDAVVEELIDAAAHQGLGPGPEGRASCRAATSRRSCWRGCCASTPRVLILDDPTRGIDVGAKAEIQALDQRARRPGDWRSSSSPPSWRRSSRAPIPSSSCGTAPSSARSRRRGERRTGSWTLIAAAAETTTRRRARRRAPTSRTT